MLSTGWPAELLLPVGLTTHRWKTILDDDGSPHAPQQFGPTVPGANTKNYNRTATEDAEEIKQLLREIRDLQKAHFERYAQFTSALLETDRRREVEAQQIAEEQEARRLRQEKYQEEMRQAVRNSQRYALIGGILLVVFLLLASGWVALSSIFWSLVPLP
jgi:hypothetical protein